MFQSFAYQVGAYQSVFGGGTVVTIPAYNGRGDYQPTYHELHHQRKQAEKLRSAERETKLDIAAVEYKIEELEFKRLSDLADEQMQLELLLLLKEQQELQGVLLALEQRRLMTLRQEDDLLVLLMSLPFNI